LLKTMFNEINPYIHNFRHISRLPTETSQVAAIWVNSEVPSNIIQKQDIVLHIYIDQLVHITEISGCYNPLAYPILLPYREQGWAPQKILYIGIQLTSKVTNIIEESNNNDELEYENNNEIHDNVNIKRAMNFEELKTVNGTVYATFKESALRRGFLENDNDYRQCMTEAREFQMPSQLHDLFATLLVFGDIADQPLIQTTLQSLNTLLQRYSKTVADYDLPNFQPDAINKNLLPMLLEELSYNITLNDLDKINTLNEAQCAVFDEVLSLIN
ncbi:9487_t:CDS:2, partial [Cetraspora pellucida]